MSARRGRARTLGTHTGGAPRGRRLLLGAARRAARSQALGPRPRSARDPLLTTLRAPCAISAPIDAGLHAGPRAGPHTSPTCAWAPSWWWRATCCTTLAVAASCEWPPGGAALHSCRPPAWLASWHPRLSTVMTPRHLRARHATLACAASGAPPPAAAGLRRCRCCTRHSARSWARSRCCSARHSRCWCGRPLAATTRRGAGGRGEPCGALRRGVAACAHGMQWVAATTAARCWPLPLFSCPVPPRPPCRPPQFKSWFIYLVIPCFALSAVFWITRLNKVRRRKLKARCGAQQKPWPAA